jgi:hypothetical protein
VIYEAVFPPVYLWQIRAIYQQEGISPAASKRQRSLFIHRFSNKTFIDAMDGE